MDLTLTPATPHDLPFLEALYREVHAPGFAPLQLPPPALDQLLAMQFRAQSTGYAAQFPHAEDQILHLDSQTDGERQPAGRMLVDRTATEIQLVDLALLAPFRNRGAGAHLLHQLIAESIRAALPLRLTVRFDNPALRLYQRLGFQRTGGDGLNLAMQWQPASPAASLPPAPLSSAPQPPVQPAFTKPYFQSLLGRICTAHAVPEHAQSATIPLLLVSVDPLPGQTHNPDSFALHFTGPLTPVLAPEIILLTPPEAQPMALFLVPTGPEQDCMRYEAIFNRETPQ